jgi:hypothetical protein
LPALEDSIKEIGLGLDYKNDLFSLTAGVKFDGADGMNKYDFYGYLDDYYGGYGYIGGTSQGDPNFEVTLPAEYGGGKMSMPYQDGMATRFKHRDEVYGEVTGNFTEANADKPFDGSHMAFLGFNFKGVKNLSAVAQAAFFNLGDFGRFGSAEIDETLKYQITPKFNAGLVLVQQFYGKDAFADDIVNSPYFEFKPEVTYNLISNVDVYLRGTVGFCEDVLENLWAIRPGLTWAAGGFGSFRVEAFYELTSTTWTEKAAGNMLPTVGWGVVQGAPPTAGKPDYKHIVGLSAMWIF